LGVAKVELGIEGVRGSEMCSYIKQIFKIFKLLSKSIVALKD